MRLMLTFGGLLLLAAQLAPASLPPAPRQSIKLDAPDDAAFDCARRFLARQSGEVQVHAMLDGDRLLGRRLGWTASATLEPRDFERLLADLHACQRLRATS